MILAITNLYFLRVHKTSTVDAQIEQEVFEVVLVANIFPSLVFTADIVYDEGKLYLAWNFRGK